jgi:hypothetical protein
VLVNVLTKAFTNVTLVDSVTLKPFKTAFKRLRVSVCPVDRLFKIPFTKVPVAVTEADTVRRDDSIRVTVAASVSVPDDLTIPTILDKDPVDVIDAVNALKWEAI